MASKFEPNGELSGRLKTSLKNTDWSNGWTVPIACMTARLLEFATMPKTVKPWASRKLGDPELSTRLKNHWSVPLLGSVILVVWLADSAMASVPGVLETPASLGTPVPVGVEGI